MKDGEYTVKRVEAGKGKRKLILKGVPKTDFVLTERQRLGKGSRINVQGSKLIGVISY